MTYVKANLRNINTQFRRVNPATKVEVTSADGPLFSISRREWRLRTARSIKMELAHHRKSARPPIRLRATFGAQEELDL